MTKNDKDHLVKAPFFLSLTDEQKSRFTLPDILGYEGPCYPVKITPVERQLNLLKALKLDAPPQCGLALIDTGAGATSVDAAAMKEMGAKAFERASLQSSLTTESVHPVYSATIKILNYEIEVKKAIMSDLSRFGLISIIGRDVLSLGNLNYAGKAGEFTFEVPGLPNA